MLVEKPFTIDEKTTKELFELAAKHRVYLQECLWTRWLKAYQLIRDIISRGEIGEVIHCQANFMISNFTDRILYKKLVNAISLFEIFNPFLNYIL